jgi:hypothetical protein
MASLRAASEASTTTSEMCAQWLVEETIAERLAQDLEDVARARGPFIQPQEAVVRQGHLPRYQQLAIAHHAHIGNDVIGGPARARGDDGGAPTRQAGAARDAGSLPRGRQARRGQNHRHEELGRLQTLSSSHP